MQIEWHKNASGAARSVRGGDYRIHYSGIEQYTTYKRNPYLKLGVHESWQAAMSVCQAHNDEE